MVFFHRFVIVGFRHESVAASAADNRLDVFGFDDESACAESRHILRQVRVAPLKCCLRYRIENDLRLMIFEFKIMARAEI